MADKPDGARSVSLADVTSAAESESNGEPLRVFMTPSLNGHLKAL
jgi:hypothetical protein